MALTSPIESKDFWRNFSPTLSSKPLTTSMFSERSRTPSHDATQQALRSHFIFCLLSHMKGCWHASLPETSSPLMSLLPLHLLLVCLWGSSPFRSWCLPELWTRSSLLLLHMIPRASYPQEPNLMALSTAKSAGPRTVHQTLEVCDMPWLIWCSEQMLFKHCLLWHNKIVLHHHPEIIIISFLILVQYTIKNKFPL